MSSELKNPAFVNSIFIVKPQDTSRHKSYTFFAIANAVGGASEIFGPFVLNVGCFADVVTYSDNSELVTNLDVTVGSDRFGAYVFAGPDATLSYCLELNNAIVNPDGSLWSSNSVFPTGNQPHRNFDLF
jgi:hypothetical protein